MKKIYTLLLTTLLAATSMVVFTPRATAAESDEVRLVDLVDEGSSDTTKVVIMREVKPYRNLQRIDLRSKNNFIHKGEVIAGLSASHSSLSTENAELLTLITDINIDGYITSIKPYAAYFYRDNRAAGVRFGYTSYGGTINSSTLDLGETNDLSFDIPYVNLSSDNYSYSIFHRSYAPLDKHGHFGVYAEMELSASHGKSTFAYENDGELRNSQSKSQSYSLSFNPGMTAFIFHNVSASLAFEFGGLNYTRIRQYDDEGEMIGSRDASNMKFMFNIFAINFGFTIHIW